MANVCQHGMDPAECLICKTLGVGPPPAVATKEQERHGWSPFAKGAAPEAAKPDVVYQPPSAGPRPRSMGLHLGLILAAVVIIGLAVWVIAGVVLAILHVVELLVVAAAAGWAGYRLGRYRGSRQRPGS